MAFTPMHPKQHAYKAGKCVETALHQVAVRVWKALDQRETALGVFVDIGGYSITPLTTPRVLLFLYMGLTTTPPYGGLERPCTAA